MFDICKDQRAYMATDELWCYCHMAIVIRAEEQENTTQPLKVGISLPLKLKENLLLTSAPNLRSSDVGGWTLVISHFSLAQLDIQVQT